MLSKYYREYGKEATVDTALGYDALMILLKAIRCAGTTDRATIRNCLAKTKGFKGITGTITFDQNGDPLNKDAVILKFGKDRIVFVKTILPN